MFPNLNSAYLIGGAVSVLMLVAGFGLLAHSRDHYKHLYLEDEKAVAVLKHTLDSMKEVQNTQTQNTEAKVIKVVKGPETVKTVVKTIHDAPLPANCKTPPLTEEAKNAF